ncbi:MAG TPA: hypothetical protein ENG42_00565 [Candidatus Aenigmarchaeota archaeon]|nr:MAG: hypothetical protein DRP03_00955 [Candidatus Aenigmarchaeota archaeon]HDD45944.1 hypothetical protein [Candidatus Aenigmarchaeota archaeon]
MGIRAFVAIFTLFIILLSGCVTTEKTENKEISAREKCIELCKAELKRGSDLSSGPCLSDNNPEWDVDGWVCDVAHWPREDVDNLRENQCDGWWEAKNAGKEVHFVEVTPECKFIRAI